MSQIQIKPTRDSEPIEFEVDLPEVDQDDPQAFIDWAVKTIANEEGDDPNDGLVAVANAARANFVVSVQSFARGQYNKHSEGNLTEDELRQNILDWKPAERRRGKSALEKATDMFESMSEDERAAFLSRLQAAAGSE